MRTGQRGSKAQPGKVSPGRGGWPAMTVSGRPCGASGRGTERSSAAVYGCAGAPSSASRRPLLHHATRIHHDDAIRESRHDPEVVRDEHDCETLSAQALEDFEHLRLRCGIERRGGLIGDQQRRVRHQRHRHDRTLALPAGKLMRVLRGAKSGITQTDALQRHHRACAGLLLTGEPVRGQHLGELCADRQVRRQRVHRVLEHGRDACASDAVE